MILKVQDLLNRSLSILWRLQGISLRRTKEKGTQSSFEYSSPALLDLQEMPGPRLMMSKQPASSKVVASTLKQLKYDRAYMSVAKIFAGLSHDDQYKVGAVIVKNGQILSQGWNGMPSGMDTVSYTHLTLPTICSV